MIGQPNNIVDDTHQSPSISNHVCKHVDFVKRNFIQEILRISHQDVLESSLDICYIPGCHASENLTAPIYMGDPPIKTISPINFIGVGLKTSQSIETLKNKWYVAYVPINFYSMNQDLYNISMHLVDVIGSGSLYKSESIDKTYQLPWETKNSIFTTPSCAYAGLDELSSILEYPKLSCKIQIVIQVLVEPASYTKNKRSLYYKTHEDRGKDKFFIDEELEWHSNSVDKIIPFRILVRILPPNTQTFALKNKIEPFFTISKSVFNESDFGEKKLNFKADSAISQAQNVYFSIPVYAGETGLELIREEPFKNLKDCIRQKETCLRWYSSPGNCKDVIDYILKNSTNPITSLEDLSFGSLAFTIPWTPEQNRIIFYLKSICGSRGLEWSSTEKIWKIPSIHIYTIAKFVHHLGGYIDGSVLSHLDEFLTKIKGKKTFFVEECPNTSIWRYLHLFFSSSSKNQQLSMSFYPFDKRLVQFAKGLKMKWNKDSNSWETTLVLFPQVLSQLNQQFDSILPISRLDMIISQYGVKLSSKRSNAMIAKSANPSRSTLPVPNTVKPDDNQVTCLLITAAGKEPHLHRVITKISSVIKTVQPPRASIDDSGNIIMGGPGTREIKFIQLPRGLEEWNQISFCVIPSGDKLNNLVSKYDQNILCSLVGEVYIITEDAIDWLLYNCTKWPDPSDSLMYNQWNDVMTKNEASLWDGHDFNARQQLAEERLFCNEEFHVVGNKEDSTVRLCTLLIELGNGRIVSNPKHAEYVIITDAESKMALKMKSKFGNNDEDLISRTHGAKHSTLVTPKFIYDCIITWKLQRPSKGQKHLAF